MWYGVKGDAGSNTACIQPWDRLVLQICICNLLWRELRYIFLLQHLSSSGCPAWVRRQQIFLFGCHAASLGGARDSCRRHSLISGAEFQHRLVSHYSSAYLHLIYLLYGFPWNLLISRSFYLQWGKPFGLAGETRQPSWSLTLNYFHSTELAAQLEADTAKCTWAQPIFAVDSIKLCMALLNNPRQTWAQT